MTLYRQACAPCPVTCHKCKCHLHICIIGVAVHFGISDVKEMYNIEDSVEPCGTPANMGFHSERFPSTFFTSTICELHKSLIFLSTFLGPSFEFAYTVASYGRFACVQEDNMILYSSSPEVTHSVSPNNCWATEKPDIKQFIFFWKYIAGTLYCIVLKGWSLRPFQIYCATPNLGITRTWICRLNFAQRRIFSGVRFFNEPEISVSRLQLKVPPGGLVLRIFTSWKNSSTSAVF